MQHFPSPVLTLFRQTGWNTADGNICKPYLRCHTTGGSHYMWASCIAVNTPHKHCVYVFVDVPASPGCSLRLCTFKGKYKKKNPWKIWFFDHHSSFFMITFCSPPSLQKLWDAVNTLEYHKHSQACSVKWKVRGKVNSPKLSVTHICSCMFNTVRCIYSVTLLLPLPQQRLTDIRKVGRFTGQDVNWGSADCSYIRIF